MGIHSAKQIVPGLKFETAGDAFDASLAKHLIRTQVKTANYQVLESDSGTYFTTYGDGDGIDFTLPANPKAGLYYYFFQSTDQNMDVNAATDTMITFGDLDADGLTIVGGTKIGACIFAFADGNIWNAMVISLGAAQTVTT